jgi:hypothetical protein
MTDQPETWEARRARVAERLAAEEALPDDVKRLLDAVRWRVMSEGSLDLYRLIKSEAVKIWGPK